MNEATSRLAFVSAVAFALGFAWTGSAQGQSSPASPSDSTTAAAADTASRESVPPERIVRELPLVQVSTTRSRRDAPFARSTLGRAELLDRNRGEDTPMLLATMPGAYAYSDAGNGIGYSYLSIRGFPQRRISVLVNGVPLNDPESHEVYWIDHPDLLASTREVELQRGVGSALYGGASVGGSVHLETVPLNLTPWTGVAVDYGSYHTRRLVLESGSGSLGDWNLYGRYSRIETDGYRDQSDSRLWSYAFSVQRTGARQWLRANLYGGPEETHLAYLGVPAAWLDGAITGDAERDRRFNPLTYAGERDHFFEPHYELIHGWSPSPHWSLTQTLFWFDGRGYYDEQRLGRSLADYRLTPWVTTDSTLFARDYYTQDGSGALVQDSLGRFTVERFDLVRRRTVANRHYGWVPRVEWRHAAGSLIVGGELRAHDGHHWGEVVSGSGLPPGTAPDLRYYDYHPRTLSTSVFARETWAPEARLRLTADLAWRHQGYAMRGDRFDGIRFDEYWDFALPRLGVTVLAPHRVTLFGSWAASRREPSFRDLYDAEGVGSVPLIRNGEPLVRPERVQDWEAGLEWSSGGGAENERHGPRARVNANLFRMDFRDELVYAGQFNTDLGYPIVGNAARSIHQGVEVASRLEWPVARGLVRLDGNASLGDHHFVEYREVYGTSPGDTVRYDGNALGFFPAVLANVAVRGEVSGAYAVVDAQHAGRLYLDNTESRVTSAGPRTIVNLTGGLRRPVGAAEVDLSVRVTNALDTRYATGGYLDYDAAGNLAPVFIPAATRGWIGQMRVTF